MNSLVLALFLSSASAAELAPDDVARLALDNDPNLAASAAEVERAVLLVLGEEHRYGLRLDAETGVRTTHLLQSEAPSKLAVSGGVTVGRDIATGTEVSLYVGMDQGSTTFATSTSDPTTSTTGVARFGITQQLGAGRGLESGWASRDQARASLDVSEATWRESASALVRDALTAYWELAYAEAAVLIDEAALVTAIAQRDEAALRVESGSLAPAELLAYETRVATLEESVTQSAADVDSRAIDLQWRLGLKERPTTGSADIPSPAPSDYTVVERAIDLSPSVLSQRDSLELARVQARTAGDNLEPSVAIQTWVQTETLVGGTSSVGSSTSITGYVGLTGSFDFDRTRYRTEVGRGAVSVQAAEQRVVAAERDVAIEAEQTVASDAAARRRLEMAERTLEIAQRQVDAERGRVEIGAGIAIEVREAEDTAREAELRVLRARIDIVKADLALDHLTGDLVDLG